MLKTDTSTDILIFLICFCFFKSNKALLKTFIFIWGFFYPNLQAFVYFSDWNACTSFVQLHRKNPISVGGQILNIHFVLQDMHPGSTEVWKAPSKTLMCYSVCYFAELWSNHREDGWMIVGDWHNQNHCDFVQWTCSLVAFDVVYSKVGTRAVATRSQLPSLAYQDCDKKNKL